MHPTQRTQLNASAQVGGTSASRRDFLTRVLVAGAGATIAGCCRLRPLPPPDLSPQNLVIDAHAHVFNGWDLDIYNYQVPHIPSFLGIGPGALYSIALIVRAVAPTGERELEKLRELLGKRGARPGTSPEKVVADERFSREVKREAARMAEEVRQRRDAILKAVNRKAQLDVLRQMFQEKGKTLLPEELRSVEADVEKAVRKLSTPAVLAFFEPFFHYRLTNAVRLGEVYSSVSLFTPAMMDTDSWFTRRAQHLSTCTPLGQQIEIYKHISIATQGRLLPYVAFDPRRDPSSLDAVRRCIDLGCFVGAKLYPPMGYRVVRNSERDGNSSNPDWTPGLGRLLDERLAELFRVCVAEEFCVMAHNNKSKDSSPEYLDNGNPKYWFELLGRDEFRGLRANLGHFGGMSNASQWRDGICELMAAFPGVYADVGAFSEIVCEEDREKFFHDIEKYLRDHRASPLLDRLMYGSDFFMNGLVPGYQGYADNWLTSFKTRFPERWTGFAGRNAAQFLGLRRGSKQLARIDRFLAEHDLRPRWRELVT